MGGVVRHPDGPGGVLFVSGNILTSQNVDWVGAKVKGFLVGFPRVVATHREPASRDFSGEGTGADAFAV